MAGEKRKIIALNKNAKRLYLITETLEAGLVLQGTEVKSIRQGSIELSDSYAYCRKGEAFLANCNIGPYKHGNRENHEPMRNRKLLLHKREIEKISAQIQEKGKSVVATCLYFKNGRVKVELGIGTGKKLHDKRQDSKKKDAQREISRAMKRSR